MSELLSFALFLASVLIYAWKAGRNTWWFAATLTVLGLFVVLNITLFASDYFTGDGINDAVLYTLTNSLTGAGVSKYILPGIGIVLGLTAVFGALGWILRRRRHHPHHFGYSLLALLLALGSVDASPAFRQITELVKSQSRDGDPDFAAYYKEPSKTIPDPKLNLVYIYGESLERTYFDNEAFPDLTPELGALKNEGLDFSHTQQLPGTDYTIAGMVASQCGIPLFAPFEGNASASVSSFFPQNICLGDILKNSGYQNYFVQGANLRFAGKDVFLKSHGFDHLFGSEELKSVVADPHYRNDWGFYDDTVLDEAWKKFEELSRSGQRFSLFTLTVDTHHPDGFISRTCNRKKYDFDGKPNQSFSAVSCSQENIATFLSQVANEPITVFCAGRTDAGVHGTGQVVHFETTALRKDAAWTLGVNANLPGDIAVRWVKAVPDDFHARFSATARRYRYIIYNHRLRPAVLSKGVTHFYEPLDAERMHRAAQCLLGENDFTSFRAVQCQSRTPWRNVMHINVTRHGPYVVVDIKANAFVHHMVRNIVGSLMEVGAHNQPESWIAELLAAKDRTLAAATAKAEGLYLVAVDYPDRYDLPKPPMGPLFLAD
ncbi:phosphatidylglycerol--membrane-oligosaccharide glycerophosphotransferase [Escherichia coli]|uniref:phosphatidylglycerol--membrane-oligosaccharide glycerophosphotransferase n=2 Tax=Escherichia coli TaxID=562 RepID=UPI0002BB28EE|nr:phosphatidylglycerol--membrane-oligosaccharide glycerophosphotransferase [Escherichia coli]